MREQSRTDVTLPLPLGVCRPSFVVRHAPAAFMSARDFFPAVSRVAGCNRMLRPAAKLVSYEPAKASSWDEHAMFAWTALTEGKSRTFRAGAAACAVAVAARCQRAAA